MTEDQKTALNRLSVDFDEVLERFAGNEELYLKCLHKFVSGNSFDDMVRAFEEGNVTDAFEAAHSLKGVSGNLGFKRLYSDVKEITEIFRAGRLDISAGDLSEVKEAYSEVLDVINSL